MNTVSSNTISHAAVVFAVVLFADSLAGQGPSSSPAGGLQSDPNRIEGTAELNRLLTGIVLEHLPHQYLEDRKWGQQERRWSGIDFRRDGDGGRLETERRYRMMNHGTWQKYSVELVDPKNQFSVALQDVMRTDEGLTAFVVNFSARLKLGARQSKWVNGVQLYSISADGHATVRLNVRCTMDTGMDFKNFPPDMVFRPTITDARILVDEFQLDRISKVGGEIAQQLSRHARRVLDDRIAEKEQKLVEKLNARIAKKQDRLRLSLADAVKLDWYGPTRDFLPEKVKQALPEK